MKASRGGMSGLGEPGPDVYTQDSWSTGGGMGMDGGMGMGMGMGVGGDGDMSDGIHSPFPAGAAAGAGSAPFQADPFLSRPFAAKGPPPPNLPFADPISTTKGKAPNISSLHFAQPISFDHVDGDKDSGKNVENNASNINWHQSTTADDGDFWDNVDDDGPIDNSHLSSIHHRTS